VKAIAPQARPSTTQVNGCTEPAGVTCSSPSLRTSTKSAANSSPNSRCRSGRPPQGRSVTISAEVRRM